MLPKRQIKNTAAVALALATIAPAAATAKPVGPDLGVGTTTQSPPAQVVRITTPASGFDWGDAGIGAAGGLALAMLGVGGAFAISQRPRRGAQTALLLGVPPRAATPTATVPSEEK
jgi:hypothetical protein